MKEQEQTKEFTWVMDICKKYGFDWFTWVWHGCGQEFACEFGIPSRNIHTGLVLAGRDGEFKNTAKNRRWLRKKIKKILE